jgi:hypothetical protein
MRKLFLLFTTLSLAIVSIAQVNIANTNFLYSQTFDALQSQTTVSYPMNLAHWQIVEYGGTYANNQYRGSNGNQTLGDIFSFGQTGSTERALGSLASGSPLALEAHYGLSFVNNTGSAITTFYAGFRQEQWRIGDANLLPDTVRVYYSTNATGVGDLAATWTEIPSLMMVSQYSDSTSSGSVLNGNLQNDNKYAVFGVNIPAGGTMWIKFVDKDNPGEDDGLAIDNFYANIGNCDPAVGFTVDSAGCYGDNNGQVVVNIYGGQAPFSYSINGGAFQTSNTFSNLTAGVYYMAIQAAGNSNCVVNTNVIVGQRDSMALTMGVTSTPCYEDSGEAWVNVTSNVNPYSYSWNSNPPQTTPVATNLASGQYIVTITAGDGCTRTDTLDVPEIPLFNGEEICSITVDSAADKNLLVWNKDAPAGSLQKYYIYRADSNAGNYALLDSVDYTAFSTYMDMTSTPSTNYYSYYITAKSACGESTPSVAHTEKRLIGAYAGGNYILNWNDYIGIPGIDSQHVYYSFNGGPWTLFSTLPIAQPGEAYFNPPAGNYRWFVALPKTGGCNPVAKSTAYEYILSNIVEIDVPVSIGNLSAEEGIVVYPNPSNGVFNLSVKQAIGKQMSLELTDIVGRSVNRYSFINAGTQKINLVNIPAGTYTLRLVAEDKAWVSKITIQ